MIGAMAVKKEIEKSRLMSFTDRSMGMIGFAPLRDIFPPEFP